MSIRLSPAYAGNSDASVLHRPVCDLLACTWPVVLAGMGGVARAELVSAVTLAGGFGFLGMVREPIERIRDEVRQVRERTHRKFGVNLIPAATPPDLLNAQITTCIELGVPVVGLFWDVVPAVVQRLRDAGVLVICQVGSIEDARAAEEAGAQVLIVQGREAGGHVRGDHPLGVLLREIVAATQLPVLAAGGIANGADVAAALSFGAQGVVLGTAFIATHESFAHTYHKQRIVDADESDTLLTTAFHINWPEGARVRVLSNSVTQGHRGHPFDTPDTVIGDEEGRPIHLFSTDSPLRSMTGDFEAMALYAGTGAGRVDVIAGAAERLHRIVTDSAALSASGAETTHESVALASPVCFAGEIHEAHMGYTSVDELTVALNELLEAKRAGAHVTSQTAAAVIDTDTAADTNGHIKALLTDIFRDEVRWCNVLTKTILSLRGTPTGRTGALYEEAMATGDLSQRMAVFIRSQEGVVRKLQTLLPQIHDEQIQNDLAAMLASHEDNVPSTLSRLFAPGDRVSPKGE
jgi:nitronate monooxygenase